eukprot:jgi/Botrbrau1/21349/Bobra.0184s0058.1
MLNSCLICSIILSYFLLSLSSRSDDALVNVPEDEYKALFGRNWLRYYDTFKTVGFKLRDCFQVEELDRDGVLKPGEKAALLSVWSTIYGAGLNASSIPLAHEHFTKISQAAVRARNMEVTSSIHAYSSFNGAEVDKCYTNQAQGSCPFNASNYITLIVKSDCWFSRLSKCLSPTPIPRHARLALSKVIEGALQELGFPDVYLMDMYRSLTYIEDHRAQYTLAEYEEVTLNLTLEIFGPCAIPFTLEKQTLLRLALPAVLENEIDIFISVVKQVIYSPQGRESVEDSVNITMTLGVFILRFEGHPIFSSSGLREEPGPAYYHDVFVEVSTSREGRQSALQKYLADAGLATTQILVHEASELRNGPPDTPLSSFKWALRKIENKGSVTAPAWRVNWVGALLFVLLVAAIVAYVIVYKIPHLPGQYKGFLNSTACSSEVSVPPSTRSSGTLSLSSMFLPPEQRAWAAGVMKDSEIQLLLDGKGNPCRLGLGSTGEVFKGMYRKVDTVAIKVLRDFHTDNDAHMSLMKEVTVLRACRHPNIVQFQGAAFVDGKVWLVMEYMDGGDLHKALQIGDNYRWHDRGAQVAYDLACALDYLHNKNTIHLDVKSANVLLTLDGRAKLADMGLMALMTAHQSHASLSGTTGTFPYMAPEVLVEGRASCSSDIYSFGVVLWEIVTGNIPKRGCLRDPRVPEECGQEVMDLINTCLSWDAASRPSALDLMRFMAEHLKSPLSRKHSASSDEGDDSILEGHCMLEESSSKTS